jgi:hypothetical protein
MPTKNIFVLCLLPGTFEGTFEPVFKDKSHKEVTKQLKSMFFLQFLLDAVRIRIRTNKVIREVKKYTDPDQQRRF